MRLRLVVLPLVLLAGLLALSWLVEPVSAHERSRRHVLTTTLTGAAEAPGPGDPDGKGHAVIVLFPDEGQLCYRLRVRGIEPATAAHIHVAPKGSPGPVVVPLTAPTTGRAWGCATVAAPLMDALKNHPENYYVNVHNASYPGDALRGQLGRVHRDRD